MSEAITSPKYLLKRLWCHLSRRRQKQFLLLTVLMIVSAFVEVVSLGVVLPFLGILISPDQFFKNPFVARLAGVWNISSGQDMVLPMTVLFVCAAVIAGAIRLLQLWASTRLTFAAGADLSSDLYRHTLFQPYQVHLSRNSSVVVSGVIDKTNQVAFWILMPVLTLISSVVLLVSILSTLIVINPQVAFISIFGFGGSYALITYFSRSKLKHNSQLIAREQTQVIKALQEGIGGIRDVLLDGTQQLYSDIYRRADHPLRRAYGSNIFIAGSPRFVMEALGMALIAGLGYYLSQQDGGVQMYLPVLGALALGAQRMLPALQQSYSAWASIMGCMNTLSEVIYILEQPIPDSMMIQNAEQLRFNDSVEFKSVSFKYGNDLPNVLENFNLKISKGSRIGFVGTTGSGKSTALDILMGLLPPTGGEVLVDGKNIAGDILRSWQKTIAHVPQSIYLADTTIAENIAFGIPKEKIDMDRVRSAARQAQIAEFIESRAEKYDAFVGERGIRLSGGQRQRIGIARALYKQASVLIFDEATSALDNETEQSVMDAIEQLSRDLTILIIAHRVSTLNRCDHIVDMKKG